MWQYTIRDLADGDDPKAWAQKLADDGWQAWHPSGTHIRINGRPVTRYALRRPTSPKPTSRRPSSQP